jgi:phosphopentomutase
MNFQTIKEMKPKKNEIIFFVNIFSKQKAHKHHKNYQEYTQKIIEISNDFKHVQRRRK